ESGAIDTTERTELEHRCEWAFQELVLFQTRYHKTGDPALHFVSLLKAALACGQAHVADRRGTTPESPETWGWRRKPTSQEWVPQGTRIGWLKGNDLFLDPATSYQIAQGASGPERISVSQQTLHQKLREVGLLASV